MIRARHGEIHHVGRQHPIVVDVDALFGDAVDERGLERGRRQPHVVAHRDLARSKVRGKRGADRPGSSLVDVIRIDAADVVGLEDVRVELHSLL